MDAVETWVDWTPVFRLLLVGTLLAAGPLLWVWLRHRGATPMQRLRALTALTLFLTFDLVLFGAFTRLTDSGLGCPDWPGCYGAASPIGARADIAAAQAAMPTGPVTWSKAWIEMIHRYLATAVGGLILVMAVVSTLERRRGPTPVVWAWLTLAWVCLQGAFGAWTVTMKLFPAIVTLHLLGGMVLLALLRWQNVRWADPALRDDSPPALRAALVGLLALVALQIALGGWVSTNYAVLACRDFPTCQGQWWPQMDFARGFELWRELGQQGSGDALPFAALTAIHYTHRLAAYVVLLALAAVGLWQWRCGQRERAWWLWGLGAWQLVTGLSNVVLEWPLIAAVAHTGGAAALVVVLSGWLAQPTRRRPGLEGSPTVARLAAEGQA
ncbi:Heme A synthase [Tepidimonas alkaliphilus]|uniref:Heme A synthase n=1 Tax=Tepidimonas alkaliphilus TaxID=2588942 RepID=A0A554W6R4_9BURK|nr:COX15/CtaA family protein [Tepidimonas alkaliphilus]TSE19268.1 Heme A synthase [Tepidimonas alkaliphilus]